MNSYRYSTWIKTDFPSTITTSEAYCPYSKVNWQLLIIKIMGLTQPTTFYLPKIVYAFSRFFPKYYCRPNVSHPTILRNREAALRDRKAIIYRGGAIGLTSRLGLGRNMSFFYQWPICRRRFRGVNIPVLWNNKHNIIFAWWLSILTLEKNFDTSFDARLLYSKLFLLFSYILRPQQWERDSYSMRLWKKYQKEYACY